MCIELKLFLCSIKKEKEIVTPQKKRDENDINVEDFLGRQ